MLIYTKNDPRHYDRRLYKGGDGGGTSTTTQSIPEELKPLAAAYTGKAINLGNQGFTPYTGQRNADLNSTQNAGIGMIQNRAMYGDPTQQAGASALQRQLNGSPQGAAVNPYASQNNPYLDAQVSKAQASVLGAANQAGARSGSFGNSGIAEQAAKQLGQVATDMYGRAYDTSAQLAESGAGRNDQARQSYASNNLNAAGLGLQYGNSGYNDGSQLLKAGQVQQDQNQNNLDFGYQQYSDQQNLPYKQLGAMSGVFGNSGLGSSSTTQQTKGGK